MNKSLFISVVLIPFLFNPSKAETVQSPEDGVLPKPVSESEIKEMSFEFNKGNQRQADSSEPKVEEDKPGYTDKTVNKIGNGVYDLATSWLQLPKTMIKTSNEEGIVQGLTKGFVKGVVNTAGQAVSGAANVVTFPVPVEIANPLAEKKSDIQEMSMEETFGTAFSTKKTCLDQSTGCNK